MAQFENASGLAFRGLASILVEDAWNEKPMSVSKKRNLVHFTVGRRRLVVRSTVYAELNSIVDSIERMPLLQATLHQIYCLTGQSAQALADLCKHGSLPPPVDIAADAIPVFSAIAASDVCDLAEGPWQLQVVSVRDRLSVGVSRFIY